MCSIKDLKRKKIEVHIGISVAVLTCIVFGVALVFIGYKFEHKLIFLLGAILAIYPINVVLHEIFHLVGHFMFGQFEGYLFLWSKKSEEKIQVKGSCVFNVKEYKYTKAQMYLVLLLPLIPSLIISCVLMYTIYTALVNIDIMYLHMLAILVLFTNIAGSIGDIKEACDMRDIKSNFVKEIIKNGKFRVVEAK